MRQQNDKLYFASGLGRRIRQGRERANLTVDNVAALLGVSASAVRSWEGGHKFPSRENMDMLATLLSPSADPVWLQTGVYPDVSERSGQVITPDRFYLIVERRDDGGLRITCPEVPGLVLSHQDPHAVMRDVLPAIHALLRHNTKVAAE